MGYQNIGQPRFYMNIYEFMHATGRSKIPTGREYLYTNPAKRFIQKGLGDGHDGLNDTVSFHNLPIKLSEAVGANGFMAYLGHNFASCNAEILTQEGSPDYSGIGAYSGVVNATNSNGAHLKPEYDGFSIHTCSFASFDQTGTTAWGNTGTTMQQRFESGAWGVADPNPYNGLNLICNSIVVGNYYDMPVSPDLKVKMSIEMDGIKQKKTKGGSTLSNAMFTGPPDWGSTGGAWQLPNGGGEGTSFGTNFRHGRRVWELSFSYLSDTHVMPSNASSNNIYSNAYSAAQMSDFGYDEIDIHQGADANNGAFRENIYSSNDFFSKVWNRALGGHLEFIFQPDGGGGITPGNPMADQFAICRFDMKSLKITQSMHRRYNVKLKIRESW